MFYPNMLSDKQLSELQNQRKQKKISDLVHSFVNKFDDIDKMMQLNTIDPKSIQTPYIMILGGKDQIISNASAE